MFLTKLKRVMLCSPSLYHFGVQNFNRDKNYYKILSLEKEASADDIKKAYYKLAKINHPDVDPSKQQRFKQINQAYRVLSDEKIKNQYDIAAGYKQDPYNNNSNSQYGNTNYGNSGSQYDDPNGYGYNYNRSNASQGNDPNPNPYGDQNWRRYNNNSRNQGYYQEDLFSPGRLFRISLIGSTVFMFFMYIFKGRKGRSQYYYDQYGRAIPMDPRMVQRNDFDEASADLVIGEDYDDDEFKRRGGYRTRQYNEFLGINPQNQQYPPNQQYNPNRQYAQNQQYNPNRQYTQNQQYPPNMPYPPQNPNPYNPGQYRQA